MGSSNSEARKLFRNSANLRSTYSQGNADDAIIDLGLSLRTLQSAAYNHPSGQFLSSASYGDVMNWQQLNTYLKSSSRATMDACDEEGEGVQSKERWAYVKVNMEGVLVGRKVCIPDHADYSSLALQLEEMFGRYSLCGLRLFQAGSDFSLFYQDTKDNWRAVGDVPWKEFADCVKRLKIARRTEGHLSSSSALT
ncbi:AUX/IAA domain [Dillenia turbinata]|uniref:Auxin-responsive protein n=1 Tax=Dillenia turbinata TaxID=194707 RepID=A0AAN8Z210_9MAGN